MGEDSNHPGATRALRVQLCEPVGGVPKAGGSRLAFRRCALHRVGECGVIFRTILWRDPAGGRARGAPPGRHR